MALTKEILLNAAEEASLQTVLIEIYTQFKKDRKNIFIIVEGKNDSCYYRNSIENIIPPDWIVIPIEAGSKKNVVAVFNAINWEKYDKKRILLFVDRDLADFIDDINIQSTNLYVTDGYSIENSLITEDVMFRTLDEVLGLHNLNNQEKQSIVSLFRAAKDIFINTMIIPMSILLCTREHGIKTNGMDNIALKDIFDISKGLLSLKTNDQELYDYTTKKLGCQEVFSQDKYLASKTQFLSNSNHKNLVYGKFMLHFFVVFLISIRDEWNSFDFAKTSAVKRSLSLGRENAFENIAVRARPVSSLRDFFKSSEIGKWLR